MTDYPAAKLLWCSNQCNWFRYAISWASQ